jgi:hypothetical protein
MSLAIATVVVYEWVNRSWSCCGTEFTSSKHFSTSRRERDARLDKESGWYSNAT